MPSKSPKQQAFFKAVKRAKHDPDYGDERLRKVASSMTDKDIGDFANHLAEFKVKKAVLSILKDVRESVEISEPMYLESEDMGGKGIDPIASEDNYQVEWAKYLPQFLGQPFQPKELEALTTFEKDPISPTKEQLKTGGRIEEVWYKSKDEMGMNKVTVIKKLKDGGQFSYNAFRKEDKPTPPEQEQGQDQEMNAGGLPPLGGEEPLPPLQEVDPSQLGGGTPPAQPTMTPPGSANPPTTPNNPSDEDNEKKKKLDDITVIKSILFKDEIKGGAILIEFLKKIKI